MSSVTVASPPALSPVRPRTANRAGRIAAAIGSKVRQATSPKFAVDQLTQSDRTAWDATVTELGGSPVQSWRWGDLFAHNGFEVERVRLESSAGIAQAQVIYERQGPFIAARVPRGPVIASDDPALAAQLIVELDRRAGARGAVSLTLEPDRPLPFNGRYADYGFVVGPTRWYPARTVRVPLADDDALFAAMRSETRYQARLGRGSSRTHDWRRARESGQYRPVLRLARRDLRPQCLLY